MNFELIAIFDAFSQGHRPWYTSIRRPCCQLNPHSDRSAGFGRLVQIAKRPEIVVNISKSFENKVARGRRQIQRSVGC